MPLPGKLTIGFLEEDNPVKGYFRIRPMYALDGSGHDPVEGIDEKYPDDGCIRIVPDKNELAGFKGRMRALGRYCALDLRKYPGENEKIRPNKNYGAANERNASIVYSDVIVQVPSEAATQVLDAQYVFVGEEVTLRADPPGTHYVVLKREGKLLGPWVWSEARDVAGCISLRHAPGLSFQSLPEAEIAPYCLTLDLNGTAVVLVTRPRLFGISDAPAPEPAPEPAPPPPPPPAPIEQADPPAPPAPIEFKPDPMQPAPRPEPVSQPWIQKTDLGGKLKAVAGRLSLRDQVLQAQSGINPRRGRSLTEVVDEQWRRSRYEQLGHPVPPEATGHPVLSPNDRAVEAVKAAWAVQDARGGLLVQLLKNEELRQALIEALQLQVESQQPAADKRMEELEAERLKLMGEIDALRVRRQEAKAQLMDELRQAHKRDLDALAGRSQALQEELQRNEAAAQAAREAAQAAQQLLSLSGEQLLGKMVGQAAAMRAAQRALDGALDKPLSHPQLYQPTAGQLISDLRVQMEAAGFGLDNDQAVNLLLCLVTGGIMVISGPAGSGKTQLARQLAQALGLNRDNGRFLQAASHQDPRIEAMLGRMDGLTPGVLMLDDANLPDAGGVMEGAMRLSERAQAQGIPLCIVLTVQDAPEGMPLSARLLSRAFFLRLEAPAPGQAWRPGHVVQALPGHTVALDTLKAILAPAEDMPVAAEERLCKLRQALDGIGYRLDRRTLNQTWAFCAGMARAGRMGELEALDLALSQRVLPAMLAGMELEQLVKLPAILEDMPKCLALMERPLPLPPL